MIITRKWAMPNKSTFIIKPIRIMIQKVIEDKVVEKNGLCRLIDPFAGNSPFKSMGLSNDLDAHIAANYHMDALDFLKLIKEKYGENSVDIVLFDPPFSPRQVSESYRKLGRSVNMQTTQSSFWSKLKKEIAAITKADAVVVSCGWNSGGIGKTLGFEITEILLVAHGGNHNDTIVTVEVKKMEDNNEKIS